MTDIFHIFSLLLMLLISTCCVAAVPAIGEIKHLGDMDGLSSHRVYSIVEDDDKVIWIGTKKGVDRFNGREIRNYELQGDFYLGDMAARKIQLFKDSEGLIWAYDNTGHIYSYSKVLDRFIMLSKLGDEIPGEIILNRFVRTAEGEMLLGLSRGLLKRDKRGRYATLFKNVYVSDIYVASGKYFLGTTDGVYAIDRKSPSKINKYLDGLAVETIFHDQSNDCLYAGTFNDGLWKISSLFGSAPIEEQCIAVSDPVRAITKLNDKSLAVGIDGGGVYLFDIESGKSKMLIDSHDSNPFSLRGNGIYALAVNFIGDLWAGSYTGGASWIKFSPSPVKRILHEKGNDRSLINNNVNGIAQLENGSICFATDLGVDIMDADGGWKHSLYDKVSVSVCPDGENHIAVGTYGDGIYIIDTNGNVLRHLRKQTSGLTSNNIFSILRDKDGDFWVGSIDGELMLLDREWNLKRCFPVTPVMSLGIVDDSHVAASTVNGFFIIDKGSGAMKRYATAEEQYGDDVSAYVIPMLFNKNGTVWLGTEGGGLNLYDTGRRKIIKSYKVSEGLPSNDVYSLVRDKDNAIWIGTGNGVAVLRDTIISSLNYVFGTAHEYNKSSGALLSNGDVMFGSTSGAVGFTPGTTKSTEYDSPLKIISFTIDGLSKEESDEKAERIFNGLEKGEIKLAHDNNSFTVNFESINLRYQDDISYRYILENFDQDWNTTSTGSLSYKNLSPGNYLLRIKGIRTSDNSTIDERQISVKISEPWYNTWWAWIFYILLLCGTAFFAIRYKLDNMKKRYYEDKIRFFINTAHDIRTPVTLAMAPLEEAVGDKAMSEHTSYLVNTAYQNIKRLKTIVSQLLDFEKIDNNHGSISKESIDLCGVLKEETRYFKDACNRKNIELTLNVPPEPACISADLNLIENVFDNLMSNACKYTGKGGKICLGLRATKSRIYVEVSDSGIGIPEEERKHIFSEVYRARNARDSQELGTGFGLLQVKRIVGLLGGKISFSSSEKTGTTFRLNFRRIYEKPGNLERQNPITNSMDEIFSTANIKMNGGGNRDDKENTILIVEDNDDMRRYLGAVFSHDYNVDLRESADVALDYITTHYPDLIICDVMMPGMQGDDFCRYIKENPETAGIPVILLTAKAGHEAMVAGLSKGADDYLSKPFSTEILKLKVRGLIENRARLRDSMLRHAIGKIADSQCQPSEDNGKIGAETDRDSILDRKEEDLSQNIDRGIEEGDKLFIEKATEEILRNISDTTFTIDKLCREMAMSRTLFYSRLKSLTGKAPQEFIRLIRLETALDLLRRGMSVTEVAENTGFVNVKYFSTLFKKQYGVQPSKYNPKEGE